MLRTKQAGKHASLQPGGASPLPCPLAAHRPAPPRSNLRSYLGYGLMAARAAVLSEKEGVDAGHPCVPLGHSGTYEYAGKTMDMKPHPVRSVLPWRWGCRCGGFGWHAQAGSSHPWAPASRAPGCGAAAAGALPLRPPC